MLNLNNLPCNIYLNFIIPYLKIEDIGNMAMTNKYLKEICDNNDIWKYFYNKTNPLKILDTSIHIGYHINDEHLSKEKLLEKYKVIKPKYWLSGSTIWSNDYKFSGCCNNCSSNLQPLFRMLDLSNYQTRNYYVIEELPENIKSEYYEECRKIHLEINKIQGYISKNLCMNTSHYIQSTLDNYTTQIKYKSFKKITLQKYLTSKKKELEKTKKNLEKNNKNYNISLNETNLLKEKTIESQQQFDKLNRFCENTKLFLNK